MASLGHPCKFQRVLRLGSITARHCSSWRQPNCSVEQRVPPIFGRATITLGIGPYSSWCLILTQGFGRNHYTICKTRNVANAQRDGRSAEYRWHPLFNAAVWLTPTTRVPCSNAAKTRKPFKFAGVPQTRQRISAVSRPKFTIL